MNILDKKDLSLAHLPSSRGGLTEKTMLVVDKFNWARPSAPGTFQMVRKEMIGIDGDYQRDKCSHDKVRLIAANWDWVLFKTITVGRRKDGTLWAIEGGHRLRASFYRADIMELPCMVHDVENISQEARTFIAGARLQNAIRSMDVFKASKVAGEPDFVKTAEIIERVGLRVSDNPHKGSLRCIRTIVRAVHEDAVLAEKVLCLQSCMASHLPINSELYRGLFCLAARFKMQDVLAEYEEKLLKFSQEEYATEIRRFKIETGKNGEVIFAKAIMKMINKGSRKKLEW